MKIKKEEWRDIPEYEGMYQVSNFGRVRSLAYRYAWRGSIKTNKPTILRPCKVRNNYLQVELRKCNSTERKAMYLHRLVAIVFCPNPNGYNEVNHKDENPQNCRADNLEWCNHKYNVVYSIAHTRLRTLEKNGRAIIRTDLSTGKIYHYPYIKAVSEYGFDPKSVSAACSNSYMRGKCKVAHKYKGNIWRYA